MQKILTVIPLLIPMGKTDRMFGEWEKILELRDYLSNYGNHNFLRHAAYSCNLLALNIPPFQYFSHKVFEKVDYSALALVL